MYLKCLTCLVFFNVISYISSFDDISDENLALNKTVLVNGNGTRENVVVDGIRTYYNDQCYSSEALSYPWLTVVLEKAMLIKQVRLTFPIDYCSDVLSRGSLYNYNVSCFLANSGFQIYVSDKIDDWKSASNLCYSSPGEANYVETFYCDKEIFGRYVTIYLPYDNSTAKLHICEFEVYGGKNLAVNKFVRVNDDSLSQGKAFITIDGYRDQNDDRFCYQSSSSQLPWLMVDIEKTSSIDKILLFLYNQSCIELWARGEKLSGSIPCYLSNSGYEIYVSQTKEHWNISSNLCYISTGRLSAVEIVTCQRRLYGRYVIIYLPFDAAVLHLCEIEVYGGRNMARNRLVNVFELDIDKRREGLRLTDGSPAQSGERCYISTLSNYLTVSLTKQVSVDHIRLYFSASLCSEIYLHGVIKRGRIPCFLNDDDFQIYIHNEEFSWNSTKNLCHKAKGDIKDVETVNCGRKMSGKYVTYSLPLYNNTAIVLCEIEVFGVPLKLPTPVLPISGNNLAALKKVYVDVPDVSRYQKAYLAVDSYSDQDSRYCYESKEIAFPWLMIDLGQYSFIDMIRLYFPLKTCMSEFVKGFPYQGSHECYLRNSGLEIYISNNKDNWKSNNNLCFKSSGDIYSVETLKCGKNLAGRFVILHLPFVRATLHVCEVEVYGDTYGCNFEYNLCKWNNTGDTVWKRQKWNLYQSRITKGNYVLTSVGNTSVVTRASLRSPRILTSRGLCMTFWYGIDNPNLSQSLFIVNVEAEGQLTINRELFRDFTATPLKPKTLDLTLNEKNIRVIFRSTMGDEKVRIYLDNVEFKRCQTGPHVLPPLVGVNVAKGKETVDLSRKPKEVTSLAIDGKPETAIGRCYRSGMVDQPWWMVDLEKIYTISNIRIYFPTGMCQIAGSDTNKPCYKMNNGYSIHLTDTRIGSWNEVKNLCYLSSGSVSPVETVQCTKRNKGRIVIISLPYSKHELSLCEVQIYAGINVAFSQFTAALNHRTRSMPSLAVDGITDTDFYKDTTCFTTSVTHSPWWLVDMQFVYHISAIRIFFPSSYCKDRKRTESQVPCYLMNSGYQIYLTDEITIDHWVHPDNLCYNSTTIQSNIETITCNGKKSSGRVLHIILPFEEAQLSLCEVEVFAANMKTEAIVTTQPVITTGKSYANIAECASNLCVGAFTCNPTPGSNSDCWCKKPSSALGKCFRTSSITGKSTSDAEHQRLLSWAIPVGAVLGLSFIALILAAIIIRKKYFKSEMKISRPLREDSYDQQKFENPIYADTRDFQ